MCLSSPRLQKACSNSWELCGQLGPSLIDMSSFLLDDLTLIIQQASWRVKKKVCSLKKTSLHQIRVMHMSPAHSQTFWACDCMIYFYGSFPSWLEFIQAYIILAYVPCTLKNKYYLPLRNIVLFLPEISNIRLVISFYCLIGWINVCPSLPK